MREGATSMFFDEAEQDYYGWRRSWLDRERDTGALINLAYEWLTADDRVIQPDELQALARLSWIIKFRGEIRDNTKAVVVPSFVSIFGYAFTAVTRDGLVLQLRQTDLPEKIVEAASAELGFVNFYAGFRNIGMAWMRDHHDEIVEMVRLLRESDSLDVRSEIYGAIETMEPLPRPRGGDLQAYNLLTPFLACIDRTGMCPIVNGRLELGSKFSALRLRRLGLSEIVEGVGTLVQSGALADAFAFDTASPETIESLVF